MREARNGGLPFKVQAGHQGAVGSKRRGLSAVRNVEAICRQAGHDEPVTAGTELSQKGRFGRARVGRGLDGGIGHRFGSNEIFPNVCQR